MNDLSNTPSAVSLADYDDAMAAAIRIMKEAQLRLSPEQEAAYKARQKAQEARYEERRAQERVERQAERVEHVPDPDFAQIGDALQAIRNKIDACYNTLQALLDQDYDLDEEAKLAPVALAADVLAVQRDRLDEITPDLWSYAERLGAKAGAAAES